jgi:hypothetical protein
MKKILLVFVALIGALSVMAAPQVSYNKYGSTSCNKGVCSTITNIAQTYAQENGTWKEVSKLKSLKGTDYACIVAKTATTDPDVNCVEYNSTNIIFQITDDKGEAQPLSVKDAKTKTTIQNYVAQTKGLYILPVNKGEEIHVGKDSTTIKVTINNTNADVYTYGTTTDVSYGSGFGYSIYLGQGSTTPKSAGFVFQNVNIPKGATINSALIHVYWQASVTTAITYTAKGDNYDSASLYPDNETYTNWTQRENTSASVNGGTGKPSANTWGNTTNIASIVQEITNRTNWANGNNIGIRLINTMGQYTTEKAFEDSNDADGHDPYLNVTYTEASPDTSNPVVTAFSPVNQYNSTSNSITFILGATDDRGLSYLSLYTNITGTWTINQTNTTPSNGANWSVILTGIPDGNYLWAAWANDTSNNANYSTNKTFTVNTTTTGCPTIGTQVCGACNYTIATNLTGPIIFTGNGVQVVSAPIGNLSSIVIKTGCALSLKSVIW